MPVEPGVRAQEALVLGSVGHGQPVLGDAVHLGQHEQDERRRKEQQGSEPGGRVDGHRGPTGRRRERDGPAEPPSVQERHQDRRRHGQRGHGQREVQRDLDLSLAHREREEHRIGQGDGHQGVSCRAGHVDQGVSVEGIIRVPQPPEGAGGPGQGAAPGRTGSVASGLQRLLLRPADQGTPGRGRRPESSMTCRTGFIRPRPMTWIPAMPWIVLSLATTSTARRTPSRSASGPASSRRSIT